jgi:hypothetical protein
MLQQRLCGQHCYYLPFEVPHKDSYHREKFISILISDDSIIAQDTQNDIR